MPLADHLTQSAMVLVRTVRRGGIPESGPAATPDPDRFNVPCLVRPLRAEALARQGRDASQGWHRVYFGRDPGLTNDDLVRVGGRTFAVRGQMDFNSLGEVFAVDCIETRT